MVGCFLRLCIVDLVSKPLVAGDGDINFDALVAHGLTAWIGREHRGLSVTENCRSGR